ncbi:GNAT family N-acetyltransferase [Brevibacterium casei]|uniref:Acetyltransferase (GNAT) family protein n=1 Tax=Brevibacterium casei CIP 102111 TaxID=1255625 RepID=A0A2H1I325_9MICO|nr:GNAT family N-acetyltransferase [Brevibacterium casei]NJE68116.1 GNAT family N-acetyltransferase [Brevibacterium sp. LS14]MCT1766131.1 GNAT family N-acetyltransferase [Brevibacterium casei]QPR40777.1 GNAT family N-acetyltransferase [Brevibacterium casei]QPR44933.1 GNAT family N-acetyltransferase [Brevibacterium casei]SMX69585.1 Acetyltransferase (GNAT) family protein [Brevibacterium casei CIP 102111]
MTSSDTPADLRSRIRPLPADTPEETFLPFVDLCFNWSMDAPTIPREELVTRPDARHYFADWGRTGDLAVACFDESGEEILGLAWLRLAEGGGVETPDEGPADAAFATGLSEDPAEAGRTVESEVLAEADAEDTGNRSRSSGESAPAEADAGTAKAGPETATDDAEDTAEPFAGYGWVAADIPELSITVLPDHQGEGIGTALLDVLLSLARMSGVEAVSLAVEDGNGAKNLYVDRGFATVGRNGDSDLMVRQLR